MSRQKRKHIIIISAIIVASFCLALMACGKEQVTDTIVIGNGQMSGVFSPFFSETADDQMVVQMTSMSLLRSNSEGEPQPYAATHQIIEDKDPSGDVIYTTYRFQLVDGLFFSDGEPVTADDLLFSIKVLCDPAYNGLSSVGSLPILGLQEYKYDREDYKEVMALLSAQAEEMPDSYVNEYVMDMSKADIDLYPEEDIAAYLGIELDPNMDAIALREFLIEAYYQFELQHSYDYYLEEAKSAYLDELLSEYILDEDESIVVSEISGVKKVDNRTVDIVLEGVNPAAIWDLGDIIVAPEHYYCAQESDKSLKKGQLEGVQQLSGHPLGAGPYIFQDFQNNVVTLTANENYILGEPETETIKIVTSNASNMLDAIILSEIDIAQVPATEENLIKAKENGLEIMTADFPGYGYIGINSININDVMVRRGLLSLMNRGPAINTYFGGLARLIERPVSASSFVYPDDAEAVYSYDPHAALAYFRSAGYVQTLVNGKPMLSRDGVQLSLVVGVGGEGIMDHPAALVFAQMKNDVEAMGGSMEIIDADMSVLVEGMYQGSWDLWAASWELGPDPDMSNRYMTDAEGNYYGISNAKLDLILQEAGSTANIELRKELYQEAMQLILDEAIELPLYQRQNLLVYNPEIIDNSSMPETISEHYGYQEEIHNIRLFK